MRRLDNGEHWANFMSALAAYQQLDFASAECACLKILNRGGANPPIRRLLALSRSSVAKSVTEAQALGEISQLLLDMYGLAGSLLAVQLANILRPASLGASKQRMYRQGQRGRWDSVLAKIKRDLT